MKINKLDLVSYGKFKNYQITFSDGLNIVSGKNGSGKSTIMAFIRAMLYGFSGRGAVGINDRKHYLPWDGNILSGSMDVTTDDSKKLKISRSSGKSQGYDKMSCINILNGDAAEFNPEEVLLCGEDAFLKTLCIKQLQSTFSGEDSEISKKLINLTHSACEDIDTEKTVEIITDYMKTFKALRGDKGKINELEKAISDINEHICAAKEKRLSAFDLANKRKDIITRKEECLRETKEIEKKLDIAKNAAVYERYEELLAEIDKLKQNINTKTAEKEILENTLSSLSVYAEQPPKEMFTPPVETASLKEERNKLIYLNKTSLISVIALAILTAVSAVCGIFIPPFFVSSALAAVGTFFAACKKSDIKDKIIKAEKEIENIENKNKQILNLLSKYGVSDIREYSVKNAEYIKANTEYENISNEIVSLSSKLKELSSKSGEYSNIAPVKLSESVDSLQEKHSSLSREIQQLIAEASHIDGVLSADTDPDEAPEILEAKLRDLISKRDEALKEYEAATLALNTINSVFSEMRSDFTPIVNEKASEYLNILTIGDIDKIYIDKKFAVNAEKEGTKELAYFSLGTADQTYFAIRLAICDLLFGKDKPLFIDDAFLQYDSEREKKAFDLLKKRADEGQQIIFFTCKPYPYAEGANIINL